MIRLRCAIYTEWHYCSLLKSYFPKNKRRDDVRAKPKRVFLVQRAIIYKISDCFTRTLDKADGEEYNQNTVSFAFCILSE